MSFSNNDSLKHQSRDREGAEFSLNRPLDFQSKRVPLPHGRGSVERFGDMGSRCYQSEFGFDSRIWTLTNSKSSKSP